MALNFKKIFKEDWKLEVDPEVEFPYKSRRYAKKVALRKQIESMRPSEFLSDPQYEKAQIWDLVYISTSCEEDNDSESEEEEEDEKSEKDEEGKEFEDSPEK